VLDPQGKIIESYGADALPVTVIIDKDGIVRQFHYGKFTPGETDKQIEQAIQAALPKS
jgi:peroxiredoxin